LAGIGGKVALSLVFAALVLAGLSAYADVQALGTELLAYRWSYFGVGLLLATGNYVLRWVRWELYLRTIGVRIPLRTSILVMAAGFVMSITPGKMGEVYKSWLLLEHEQEPVARTAPVVVAERVTDLAALVILAALGALVFPAGRWVALAGLILVSALLSLCMSRPLARAVLSWLERISFTARFVPTLRTAYDSLATITQPKPLIAATAIALLSWFLECVALFFIVLGFTGASIGMLGSLFAYSGPTLVGALAMLPGGLGVTEASMTGVLQGLGQGLTPTTAAAVTILVRLATLWWAVLLGALALIPLQTRKKLAKRTGETPKA
jgi:uncharacterized protein (TIRG00374 family)